MSLLLLPLLLWWQFHSLRTIPTQISPSVELTSMPLLLLPLLPQSEPSPMPLLLPQPADAVETRLAAEEFRPAAILVRL